jgi:hypothetical protein
MASFIQDGFQTRQHLLKLEKAQDLHIKRPRVAQPHKLFHFRAEFVAKFQSARASEDWMEGGDVLTPELEVGGDFGIEVVSVHVWSKSWIKTQPKRIHRSLVT